MTRDTLFYSNVFFFPMITFWKRLPIFSLLRKLLFWVKYSSSFRIYHVPSFTHGTTPQSEKEKSFPFLYIFLLRHLTHCCLWQNKKHPTVLPNWQLRLRTWHTNFSNPFSRPSGIIYLVCSVSLYWMTPFPLSPFLYLINAD